MPDDDKVTVSGKLVVERPKAYLVRTAVGEVWLPKSQVSRILRMPDDEVELDIPYWLAKAKGLED